MTTQTLLIIVSILAGMLIGTCAGMSVIINRLRAEEARLRTVGLEHFAKLQRCAAHCKRVMLERNKLLASRGGPALNGREH